MPIVSVTGLVVTDSQNKANTACTDSIGHLRGAIQALKNNTLSQAQRAWLNHYFLLEGDNAEIPNEIIAILKTTKHGLKHNNITLNIDWYNFVNSKKAPNVINLARGQFIHAHQAIRYLIHEASHLYAATDDHAERGYTNNQGQYRQPGLTPEEALKNADSYACFVSSFHGLQL